MTFAPIYMGYPGTDKSGYLYLPTQSFEASASIGAVQMGMLYNNMEWLYHFENSQQIINATNFYDTSEWASVGSIAGTQSRRLGSFGPFKFNLDKSNQPQPLLIYFSAWLQERLPLDYRATGAFTFSVRAINEVGPAFPMQTAFYTTNSSDNPNQYTRDLQPWTAVTTSVAPLGYTITDSCIGIFMNAANSTNLVTKTTLSFASGDDNSQKTFLGYIDVNFTVHSWNASATTSFNLRPTVNGLYVRELCGIDR